MSLETLLKPFELMFKPIQLIDDLVLNTYCSLAERLNIDQEKRREKTEYVLNGAITTTGIYLALHQQIVQATPIFGITLSYVILDILKNGVKKGTEKAFWESAQTAFRVGNLAFATLLDYNYVSTITDPTFENPNNISYGIIALGFTLASTKMYLSSIDQVYSRPPPKPNTSTDKDGWIRFE
ncbi:MAG: hypothetical protein A2729_04960 [Candidatus Buchananbacteria bacterium RIFCSPHIGHO2_01_FULL_39_14]|uniref:Uncharacterized protein n=1 Tax=Candidatus Buchananbacteria bacterium RIFCSPHIGHO2_01_FULL_39_14 TaxID=1797532 RepID=A0A1G1XSS8_9BACT|nr:MAG: hypothetical protein A2729_04960 [Candidatus Buchananbacteria bacterium RIFCSPHIGHO2_01_FULL_39_14]